ncbi:molybdate ABC transporter substrate-binding protein [Candidatus Igneacidithiobacillus taiwanensis]|uniref:molybdate ABC transporter substrate-binding protein n=1 Tax=Candidatus Igneacidithiobacillus taiwanensis TaxID=1945924 RepID=UPI0028983508|nr:molybdate ABC transporter substrate-binding protein [Candidatus Igneacidithiobacillus taiwanensis]
MNRTIHIFASLTLAEPFQGIIRDFTASRPDVIVQPTYGFCGALMEKMAAGAAVDVFAPSSEAMLAKAVAQGLAYADGAVNYARNRLVLVGLRSGSYPERLGELSEPRFARIAIGDPGSVPPGRYGRMALENAGLWRDLEPRLQQYSDGIQPLKAVLEGRADVAFIFASTASGAADRIHILDVPVEVSMHYPVAVARNSAHLDLARAFLAYLQTAPAQELLRQAGFSSATDQTPSVTS